MISHWSKNPNKTHTATWTTWSHAACHTSRCSCGNPGRLLSRLQGLCGAVPHQAGPGPPAPPGPAAPPLAAGSQRDVLLTWGPAHLWPGGPVCIELKKVSLTSRHLTRAINTPDWDNLHFLKTFFLESMIFKWKNWNWLQMATIYPKTLIYASR